MWDIQCLGDVMVAEIASSSSVSQTVWVGTH